MSFSKRSRLRDSVLFSLPFAVLVTIVWIGIAQPYFASKTALLDESQILANEFDRIASKRSEVNVGGFSGPNSSSFVWDAIATQKPAISIQTRLDEIARDVGLNVELIGPNGSKKTLGFTKFFVELEAETKYETLLDFLNQTEQVTPPLAVHYLSIRPQGNPQRDAPGTPVFVRVVFWGFGL